jgi:RNase P/RNase MRP subunit POP5
VRRDKSRLYTRRFIVETRFIASRVVYTKGHFARGIVAAARKQVREAHAAAKPYQADRSAPSRTSGATVRVGGAGMSEANRA